jgi:hypothetical protein
MLYSGPHFFAASRAENERLLELKASFSRAFCHGSDPTVVEKSTAIENNRIDANFLGSFRDHLSHNFGPRGFGRFAPSSFPHGFFKVTRRGQRPSFNVVNQLRINVSGRAKHIETGPPSGSMHLCPDSNVSSFSLAQRLSVFQPHVILQPFDDRSSI